MNHMKALSRRDFLALSAIAVLPFRSLAKTAKSANFSFSTLGCPNWDVPKIISFARDHHYHGVEFRGLHGQLDLPKSPHFSSANIASTRQAFKDSDLKIVCLGSSAQMHHRDSAALEKNLDEARKYIDLAEKLDCAFVRVFPEKLGTVDERNSSIKWIAENLLKLSQHASGSRVTVLLESHGELVKAEDLYQVMKLADSRKIGMIWDIVNMWAATAEAPAKVYSLLKPYIRHVHVKDFVREEGKLRYVFPGRGEAPLAEVFSLLKTDGYDGFYSFEWEKLWHPELEDPEDALADYAIQIRKYVR
jgi:sugar phosphate isomerase/epimerase